MRGIAIGSSTAPQPRVATAGTQQAAQGSFQQRLSGLQGASSTEATIKGEDILQRFSQEMRSMLHLQYELSKGTTSLTSNLMKARHEAAKNSIANIR